MPVTTYVFGAGASAHAGYPLVRNMGKDFLKWLRPRTESARLRSYEKYFAGRDFESALNEMAKLLTKPDLSAEEAEDKVAFVYFRDQIRAWFEDIGTERAITYQRFATEIAKPGDGFISFNYDTCLERALHHAGVWEIKDGYGFAIPGFERDSSTILIKAHGSVNWTIPVNTGNLGRPVIGSKDCRALGYPKGSDQGVSEPFFEAGPLLAVPITEKKFYVDTSLGPRFKEFWEHLWAIARELLSKSDTVIIIGYSLPPADKLAREAIFSSIRKATRIEIVCGFTGAGIVEEFSRAGLTRAVVATESRFEDWVAAHSEDEEKVTETRTEKDSLGKIEVPTRAMYGAQTARAVENYPISGMRAHPALIRAVGMVKRAAAEANRELGVVCAERADAIVAAAQEVIDGRWDAEFVVDVFQAGAGVSFHMNANEVIANRANQIVAGTKGADEAAALGRYEWVHPNDHVNYGQSTNDVFPTAMRLGALLALEGLYPVLDGLAGSFAAKAREFDGILKAGRTHMQDAVPIRLGQEFAAYGVAVRKAGESIRRAGEALRELGLGGSAVGTGINTHPGYRVLAIARLAAISGQALTPAEDMRWAMQSCAPMAEVSGALRGLALEAIRISNDLRLLASGPNTGLHEIELPSLQPGSSIMPGKINPVIPELAAMVGFQVVGNDAAVAMAVQAGQLELNVMMPTMAYSVLQSIHILTNMLRQLDERCVRGLTANRARCEFYAQSTVSLATALNPYIGYAKAAEIVKESIASGRGIIDVARDKRLLTEAQIAEILDPGNMTGPA